jgi:hypothetical protein
MTPSPLSSIDLHDIHAATAPEFWPPAPGWWLLAVVVIGTTLFVGRHLIKAWRRRQLQNHILVELETLNARSPAEVATHVSTLLRRVALMCFERNEVASLSGDAWLSFLDRTGGNGAFSSGIGNVLATAPYAAHDANDADSEALLSLARQWIRQNLRQQRKRS